MLDDDEAAISHQPGAGIDHPPAPCGHHRLTAPPLRCRSPPRSPLPNPRRSRPVAGQAHPRGRDRGGGGEAPRESAGFGACLSRAPQGQVRPGGPREREPLPRIDDIGRPGCGSSARWSASRARIARRSRTASRAAAPRAPQAACRPAASPTSARAPRARTCGRPKAAPTRSRRRPSTTRAKASRRVRGRRPKPSLSDPRRDRIQRAVPGEVGMNRSDGHEARVHRVEVRIRRVGRAPNPPLRTSRCVSPVASRSGTAGREAVPVPESRHPARPSIRSRGRSGTFTLSTVPGGNGAVPERPHQPFHDRGRGLVAVRVPPHQRDRDRRQTEMAALERRRHGAPSTARRPRVSRPALMPDTTRSGSRSRSPVSARWDAVGRRALDHDEAVLARFRPKRNAERERVARSAPIPVGGRYRHLPALREGAPQAHEPRRAVAIVIAQEDAHRPPCCAKPAPGPPRKRRGHQRLHPEGRRETERPRPRREGSSQNGNP